MTKSETDTGARDYRATLFLPATEFPMKAGLPEAEPKWLKRWEEMDLYGRIRAQAKGRPLFVLHDGPPYANGEIHSGTGLNKVLKDIVVRSRGFLGFDAPYIPGWDCHGLPIEWKIEEKYRKEGKSKDDVPIAQLRRDCREFAEHWIGVQRTQFKRLGCMGLWDKPYTTMDYRAEAVIAGELHKFVEAGLLYRGFPPGDVVAGREDRARRGRGRVSREDQPDDLCEVSGGGYTRDRGDGSWQSALHRAGATGLRWKFSCYLDNYSLDYSGKSSSRVLRVYRLRVIRGPGNSRRKFSKYWRTTFNRRHVGRSSCSSSQAQPCSCSKRQPHRTCCRAPI